MFLNKVSRDVASRAFPGFARVIENKNNLKMVRMLFLQGFKFFTKENILLSYIGVKQFEFRVVAFVGESMVENLVERGAVTQVSFMCQALSRETYMPEPPPIKATSSNWLAEKWDVKVAKSLSWGGKTLPSYGNFSNGPLIDRVSPAYVLQSVSRNEPET